MNDTPRRYPRTMQEAFGPYVNHHIDEPCHLRPARSVAVSVILCAALAAILWLTR